LEAAGAVFAEAGFRDATVREICRRAGANIAAVNYHFGDKEKLYAEVLRHSQGKALERHPLLLDVADDAPPEKKLRALVLSLLLRIFDKGPAAWHGRLMSREMIEPTAALDSLVEERIRPMSDQVRKIVAEILDCPVTEERVRLCSFSVVSQCVFYHHCQPLILRLAPQQQFDPAGIARLADHIARFSLAAIKHLPESKPTKTK
jgi:AcrR family transcriptional regulator